MTDIKFVKTAIDDLLKIEADKISIIELVDRLVAYAFFVRASDLHLEPSEDRMSARFRIDGILKDLFILPAEIKTEVISRIKVLAGLKTDIHHVPQDGRFRANIEEGQDIDIRVSITPTYYGENAVLRILSETVDVYALEDLGFSPDQMQIFNRAIRKPYGMILANGPTGSGKTTTLYTVLKKLNTREVSIITIEDPIEYSVAGITQIPVNVQAGLTFANGLRSILRQDPNIIMVGEIRDSETANIAINAALTGHLVLSTIHTNDSATTFPRLVDMGVPPFLVASTVNVALAQRLVRKVCPKCRKERSLSLAELKNLGSLAQEHMTDHVFTIGEGCSQCDGLGYKGRLGIFEVLEVNDDIRSLIVGGADASQIRQMAVKSGMKTMIEDGIEKSSVGITTIEEVLRIIYE